MPGFVPLLAGVHLKGRLLLVFLLRSPLRQQLVRLVPDTRLADALALAVAMTAMVPTVPLRPLILCPGETSWDVVPRHDDNRLVLGMLL